MDIKKYCECRSIEAAVEAYREAGGTASIFVNDDGLQLLGDEARMHRIQCVKHPFTASLGTHVTF